MFARVLLSIKEYQFKKEEKHAKIENIMKIRIIFRGVNNMAVTYKKLWKLLIDKDMKKKDLQLLAGISASSITKLGKNENVNMDIIEKICIAMKCDVSDILEITDDE